MLEGTFFVGIIVGVGIESREFDSVDRSIGSIGGGDQGQDDIEGNSSGKRR